MTFYVAENTDSGIRLEFIQNVVEKFGSVVGMSPHCETCNLPSRPRPAAAARCVSVLLIYSRKISISARVFDNVIYLPQES